jgi:hypothetical protein
MLVFVLLEVSRGNGRPKDGKERGREKEKI